MSTTSSKWLFISSAGDSITILIRFERFLSLMMLHRCFFIRFICEELLSTDAVVAGMERLIEASLLKLGNSVFITLLEHALVVGFSCYFQACLPHRSEVMMASLLADSPSNVSAGFTAP